MMGGWSVEVINDETGEVVKKLPAKSERDAERIERGIDANLNHDEFTCRVVEPK